MYFSFLTQFVLVLYFLPGINSQESCSSENDIRLEDGEMTIGRVEVCLNSTWGTVCDDGWDTNDAITVCRQLGHNSTGIALASRESLFGPGSGPIHLTNARCRSNETRLTDCDIDRTGINNSCNHSEEAGVYCMRFNNCENGDVRLEEGENEREGRVEFCYNGVWGTVCNRGWDEVDANVVCSQLGFGNSAVVSNSFGTGARSVLLRNVACNQSHSKLSQCVPPEEIYLTFSRSCGNNCAGVKCVDSSTTEATPTTAANGAISGAVIGAVIGVLAAVIVAVIIMVMVLVLVAKRRNRSKEQLNLEGPGPVTNLLKDENVVYKTTTIKELKNPIYSAGEDAPAGVQPLNVYDTIYSDPETKVVVNTLYDTKESSGIPDDNVYSDADTKVVVNTLYDTTESTSVPGDNVYSDADTKVVVNTLYDTKESSGIPDSDNVYSDADTKVVVNTLYDTTESSGAPDVNLYSYADTKVVVNTLNSTTESSAVPDVNVYSYADTKVVVNTLNCRGDSTTESSGVPGSVANGAGGQNGTQDDDNFYSALGPTDRDSEQQPSPPQISDTGYSCLQHK